MLLHSYMLMTKICTFDKREKRCRKTTWCTRLLNENVLFSDHNKVDHIELMSISLFIMNYHVTTNSELPFQAQIAVEICNAAALLLYVMNIRHAWKYMYEIVL